MIKKKKNIIIGDTLFEGSNELPSKLLVLFGDGLSCERFRNIKDDLLKKSMSFTNDYKHTSIILKALENVVMLPGDLHGCFHILGCVYKLFYGGLIQPIQIALGYKRIDNNKVEKTFGQCSILVHRILHECECQAYDAYIFYIYNKNESH